MLHSALKLIRHRRARLERWDPLLAVYYLTYACDHRCPYCSDGAERPYYQLRSKELPAERVLALLHTIRDCCDHLVLTGGEPLNHPEFSTVMAKLGGLGFSTVALTTNGDGLEPHLDLLPGNISDLVLSLDTLDHNKTDTWHGVGHGTLQRLLDLLDRLEPRPSRGYDVTISSVVTPDNIDDLHDVAEFAWSRGFTLAACPQLVGVKAHAELHDNDRYRALFDRLIRAKKRGRPVFGTVAYLEHMRDLRDFNCHPLTVLAVAPNGDLFYPCLELGQVAGNLPDQPDLDGLLRAARERFGDPPRCGNQCHSACALGFSLLIEHPSTALPEGLHRALHALRRRR